MLHKTKKRSHFKKKQKNSINFEVLNIFVRQLSEPNISKLIQFYEIPINKQFA